MKNFMFNSNAKKKISITSALFSLLILFFTLNCGFCGNFCSAEYSGTDDGTFNNSEASRSEEETTTEIKTPKEGEEEDKDEFFQTKEEENHNKEKDETDDSQAKKDEQPSEEQESKGKDLCPFLCTIC